MLACFAFLINLGLLLCWHVTSALHIGAGHENGAQQLQNTQLESNGVTDYGNWCGANHGGFQNCCANSTACPSCKVLAGKTPDELLTDACLKECPPKDDIDRACAYHDACTFSYPGPKKLKCIPQGNLCACDCLLVQQVKDVKCPLLDFVCTFYKHLVASTFSAITDCWLHDPAGAFRCLQEEESINDFCTFANNSYILKGVVPT